MRQIFLLLSTAALLPLTPVHAQSANTPSDEDGDGIIVNVTRLTQPADSTGLSVSVIDREEIEQRQAVSVSDLLADTAGVAMARNGGLGSTTSLFVRGADSAQLLVLIDGVRVNDPSAPAGASDFGDLLTGPVERIELLRGSHSVAWGSQAIGGVLDIQTRKVGDTMSADAAAEYGYADTVYGRAQLSVPVADGGLSLGGAYVDSDGISQFAGGTERDAYENRTAHGRLDLPIGENFGLDLRGYYAEGTVGIDGFPAPDYVFADTNERQETAQWLGYAGVTAKLFDGALDNRLAYSRFDITRDLINPDGVVVPGFDGVNTFASDGKSERFEYQGTLKALKALDLSFGVERESSEFSSANNGGTPDSASADVDSAWLLGLLQPFDDLSLTAGVRRDDHSIFGGATTLGANAAYKLADQLLFRVSYGEGFKAPTLYQLFSADYGNDALQPARSQSYDAGVELRTSDARAKVSATWFRRDTDNLIVYVSCFGSSAPQCAGGSYGYYDNISRAEVEGMEVEFRLKPDDNLDISANYTLTDAFDRGGGATDGMRLQRRPKHQAAMLVDWMTPIGLHAGATVRLVGDRFDDASNSTSLDGYELVDIRASKQILPGLEVYARVENLFDVDYRQVAGYGTYGRAAFGGLRVKLGR